MVRGLKRKTLSASVVAISLVLLVRFVPPLYARAKAAAVLADAAGFPFPRPFAPAVEVDRIDVGGVSGDLYSPDRDAPTLLLIPGAAREGRSDPRVVRVATSLAKANRRVFVPELHLYDRTFRQDDIERIGRASVALAEDGPIGVVAFSYGASFALIAAQAQEVQASMEFVAVFGAYYDLLHLVQGITTGVTLLDGEERVFDTVPVAREILIDSLVRIAPDTYEERLRSAIAAGDPAGLPPEAMSLFDLISNNDPKRVQALAANLPERYKDFLAKYSPSRVIDRIQVPVYILQARDDEATPWTEAEYLERNLEDSRLLFLEHFSHVDPPGVSGLLLDAPDAWRFVSYILAAQE
jgi:pimeloyl-ACP methyl ester carboxylesterase